MKGAVRVSGEVDSARVLDQQALRELPGNLEDVGALVSGRVGGCVPLGSILDAVGRRESAKFIILGSADGTFEICLPLAAIADRAVIAYRLGNDPLPRDLGGPVRLYVIDSADCGAGDVDACANVKDLGTIVLASERRPDVGHAPH